MKYLSLILAVALALTFFVNIGTIFGYEDEPDEGSIAEETFKEDIINPLEDVGIYEGLRSIKDNVATGNLDSNELSFNTPTNDEDLASSTEIGDEKKVFFFGKPVTENESLEEDWTSDWFVDGGNMDYTSPSVPQGQESMYNQPLEVTFDRFLNGE